MKLHSPKFERGLRRAVQRAVRGSPVLRREAKRNRVRRHYSAGLFVRVLASVGLGFAVWGAYQATGHATTALAVMSLWLGAFVPFRAANLLACLFQPADGPALACLPISDETVFRWERQKFVRSSVFSLVDVAVGFAVLNLVGGLSWPAWLALPFLMLVAWVALAALAALLAARAPNVAVVGRGLLFAGGFVVFIASKVLGDESKVAARAWQMFDAHAAWISGLLPTGWPVSLHQLLLPGSHWTGLICLALTGILVWSLRGSYALLRRDYSFKEVQIPEAPDLLAAGDAGEREPEPDANDVPRTGVTAIQEIVEQRQFLETPGWRERGWMERRLWNWLTARERVLSEFAFVNGLSFSAAWKKIFRNLLIGLAAGFAVSFASPVIGGWIAGFGVFVSGCQVLAQILVSGDAFQKVQCSGVQIPVHAVYAIGFRELSSLLFKCTAVQLPLLLVFTVGVTLAAFRVFSGPQFSLLLVVFMGLKAGGLLAAVRFPVVALSFSSGTNDSHRIRLVTIVLFLAFALFGLLFLLLGGASLFVPHVGASWVLFVLALLDAYALFRIYGWFYNANKFDLMSLPQR